MSVTTEEKRPATVTRDRVPLADLARLTWRQHRTALIATTVAVLALCGWMLWNNHRLAVRPVVPPGTSTCYGVGELHRPCVSTYLLDGVCRQPFGIGTIQVDLVAVLAAIIAVFWAAPMLAREYEQRTNLLVWSQDVSPSRWLLGKVLSLGGAAVVLALVLGSLAGTVTDRLPGANLYEGFYFEAFAPLQALYAAFGFALGLAVSAWLRRVVPAVATTLVAFIGFRVLVGVFRFGYLPPVRAIMPFDGGVSYPAGTYLMVGNGAIDAAGHTVTTAPAACGPNGGTISTLGDYVNCMRANGIVRQFVDFQPAGRVLDFRLIECGIYLILTVAFGFLAWSGTRRA